MGLKGKIFLISLFMLVSLLILSTGNAAWQDRLRASGSVVTRAWQEVIEPIEPIAVPKFTTAPVKELPDISPTLPPEDQETVEELEPTTEPAKEESGTGGSREKDAVSDEDVEDDGPKGPAEEAAEEDGTTADGATQEDNAGGGAKEGGEEDEADDGAAPEDNTTGPAEEAGEEDGVDAEDKDDEDDKESRATDQTADSSGSASVDAVTPDPDSGDLGANSSVRDDEDESVSSQEDTSVASDEGTNDQE